MDGYKASMMAKSGIFMEDHHWSKHRQEMDALRLRLELDLQSKTPMFEPRQEQEITFLQWIANGFKL